MQTLLAILLQAMSAAGEDKSPLLDGRVGKVRALEDFGSAPPKEIWSTKVPSKSRPGTFYNLIAFADGTYSCDCPGRTMQMKCRHVRGAVMMLEGSVIFQEIPVTKTSGKGKKPVPICENCGAKMVKYKQALNKGLISALIKIERASISPVNVRDIGISHVQKCNFQKLKYFGLVEPFYDDDENKKDGVWQITPLGIAFLKNEVKVHKFAWTYRDEWVSWDGDLIGVNDIFGGYKYREEWAAEAIPNG